MAMVDLLLNGFVTLFVIVDPLGLIPVYLALTPGISRKARMKMAWKGCLIAFFILTVFALLGLTLLEALGISLGAFRVAGGLFLFVIGFELVFERRNERKGKSATKAVAEKDDEPGEDADVAAFPLAIPLIAGPGAIAAVILLSGQLPSAVGKASVVAVIAVTLLITCAALSFAHRLDDLLGATGRGVISRVLGVILAALAVQFVADGIGALFSIGESGGTAT
ncbi:MarC family protein [Fulvimarina sp. MAC8]|uniref:MarC family protein n=1 Tax=Fulvimarina sp. MAC8 TaxID=3162874 RepID=UPI0032EF3D5F